MHEQAGISDNTPTAGKGAPPAPAMTFSQSPWTFREKVRRTLWMLVGKPLFRLSFHNWYGLRAAILRAFGARVGRGCNIRPTVRIEIPWLLEIGHTTGIGDHVILYDLGPIRIGSRTTISQYAHLCAGTHDYTDPAFPLLRQPIEIGDDVWIGTDAFVGPGVRVGDRTVLGARSSAYKDLPPDTVCVGNPAKPIKPRDWRDPRGRLTQPAGDPSAQPMPGD